MKKITNLLITLLVLSGCSSAPVVVLNEYQHDDFRIGVLPNWQSLEKFEFSESMPDQAIIAFVSEDPKINITVVRELLSRETTSLKYANANGSNAEKTILDYEKIAWEEAYIDGEETRLHIFKGRINKTDVIQKYLQIYVVQGNIGYTVSGSLYLDSSSDVLQSIRNVLLSFTFTKTPDEG